MELRYKKRPTRKLSEVVDCDLLTAQEKFVKNEIGGFYSIGDESAYFRLPGELKSVTVDQFEKMLKKINPNFFIMFNNHKTSKYAIEGHALAFYVPEYRGFVPLCKVGRSGNNVISANTLGSKEKYIGKKSLAEKEKAVVSRGYIAALEFCKQFLFDVKETGPIKETRIIKAAEFMTLHDLSNSLGGDEVISRVFTEARIIAEKEMDKRIEEKKIETQKKIDAVIGQVEEAQKETNIEPILIV